MTDPAHLVFFQGFVAGVLAVFFIGFLVIAIFAPEPKRVEDLVERHADASGGVTNRNTRDTIRPGRVGARMTDRKQ